MKLNNRFIFGLLSILLAAVIAFVALPTIAKQTNGKTEIVRITKPVLKGEQISADNTETVEVGSYNLPPNIARSLNDVKGLYATADLSQGDYILTSKISAVPVSSDAALNNIPSGQVAISLTVKTLASGLSDKLQPNDIIRVYHFLDAAEEVPELRYVRVLSVTDAKGINVDNTKEPVEDEEKQQSATITVLASPEQFTLPGYPGFSCNHGESLYGTSHRRCCLLRSFYGNRSRSGRGCCLLGLLPSVQGNPAPITPAVASYADIGKLDAKARI